MLDFLKRIYFDTISILMRTISLIIGHIHMPWSQKLMKHAAALKVYSKMKRGDFLLTRTHGELTTLIIPGFWKHATVITDTAIAKQKLIHAVTPHVRYDYIADYIEHTDNVALLRLRDITDEEVDKMLNFLDGFLGVPYDRRLELKKKDKVFCSELVYHGTNHVRHGLLEPRKILGFNTFTPDDLYNARGKFELICEFRDGKEV